VAVKDNPSAKFSEKGKDKRMLRRGKLVAVEISRKRTFKTLDLDPLTG